VGTATLRQKVLPLSRRLELFGQYAVAGPDTFKVADVMLGTKLANFEVVCDYFAPGDFEKLSATDQISRDSFELMDAGVVVQSSAVTSTDATKMASVAYQTKIIDSSWKVRKLPVFPLGLTAQLAATQSGPVAMGMAGRSRFARRDRRTAGVVLQPETYTVATTDTLTARPDIAAAMTRGAALSVLRRSGVSGLQVVPQHETESSG
jgi:hypothetical protein